jgi:hypothetical protein
LGEKIAHHLPVGLEAGLVGLRQEADRLVEGGIAPVELLRLAGEFCDALQQKLRVPVDAAVRAVGLGFMSPLSLSSLGR